MTTLDELERLARAATPGPWIRSGCRRKMGDEDCIMVGPDGFLMAALPIGQPRDHAGAFNDAAFIAAANPATILALLSERAELLAAVERMRAVESSQKPVPMTAQDLADHAADAFDNALPDDALPHEVGRAWKAVGERLAAILAERAEE